MDLARTLLTRLFRRTCWLVLWILGWTRSAALELTRQFRVFSRGLYRNDPKYRYSLLKHDEIRVLQLFPGSGEDPISCHLIKKPIVKCGTPEALSYTWGQELATEIIRIDGKELLVTPNLHAALRRLRQDLPLPLPSDPKLALHILLERFEAIATIPGSRCFTQYGLKSIPSCYGEAVAEWILLCASRPGLDLQPQPGDSREAFSSRILNDKDIDATALDEMWCRRLAMMQKLIDENITEEGRKRLAMLPRTLWIDAICINQEDPHERAEQVGLMRRIYKRASRLVIWLGKDRHESDRAIGFISKTHEHANQDGLEKAVEWVSSQTSQSEFMATWVALARFYSRQWFKRTWIVQEYIVGSKDRAIWMCGSHEMSHGVMETFVEMAKVLKFRGTWALYGTEFKAMMERLEAQEHDMGSLGKYNTESPEARSASAYAIFHRMSADFVRGFRAFASLTHLKKTFTVASENGINANDTYINFWLSRLRITESSDPRDKIYAILGLLEESNNNENLVGLERDLLIVDYDASIQDVYDSLVCAIVTSTKQLGILSACTNRGDQINRSWTPDWSQQTHFPLLTFPVVTTRLGSKYGSATPQYNFGASRGMEAAALFSDDLRTMTVKGVIWDNIDMITGKFVHGSSSFVCPKFEVDLLSMLNALQDRHGNEVNVRKLLLRAILRIDDQQLSDEQTSAFDDWLRRIHHRVETSIFSDTTTGSRWRDDSFLTTVLDGIWTARCLAFTNAGCVGQTPEKSLPGDLVCVIPGCPIPMILRRVDQHYDVIGEAYFDGIMSGEVVPDIENGTLVIQDFELW